jgi:S1-C subfamily serine protease
MVGLVGAAVLGGAIALGGAAAFGKLGSETTYRPVVAASTNSEVPTSFANGKALSIHDIFQRWSPGVVQITSTSVVNLPQDPLNNFFGNSFAPQQQEQQSLGSGFVIDKAGHIVTNYHVIQGAKSVQVSFSNGDNLEATRSSRLAIRSATRAA